MEKMGGDQKVEVAGNRKFEWKLLILFLLIYCEDNLFILCERLKPVGPQGWP